MKIISAEVHNFASYKHLEFSFIDQGLTLISGPTGSGKSTLCDIIPWTLFGITSKNGAADEVRSWSCPHTTRGQVILESKGVVYTITRKRNPNDLSYSINYDYTKDLRGKDLNDTQKQINQLLNMSAETYLAGAYLHEFSQTSQFFTLTAKNRRMITEQLADLTLAKSLQEKLSAYNKELKKDKDDLQRKLELDKNSLNYLDKSYVTNMDLSEAWEDSTACNMREIEIQARDFNKLQDREMRELEIKHENWKIELKNKIASTEDEIDQLQRIAFIDYSVCMKVLTKDIEELRSHTCHECGAPKNVDQVLVKTKELYDIQRKMVEHEASLLRIDTLNARLSRIKTQVNPYSEMIEKEKERKNTYLAQLEEMKTNVNPYTHIIQDITEQVGSKRLEIANSSSFHKDLSMEQSDIELLLESIAAYRSVCIENTVVFLQHTTNKLLEEHFDAELRVTMSASDTDKLDIEITKDGNSCSYTQLSKGQRQILRLAFGVAIMKSISMHNAISFNCLFFDEVFSGLDEEMKAKGFNLLETLALTHESVFVIDHSTELKSRFTKEYRVQLINGNSEIEES